MSRSELENPSAIHEYTERNKDGKSVKQGTNSYGQVRCIRQMMVLLENPTTYACKSKTDTDVPGSPGVLVDVCTPYYPSFLSFL